MKRRLDAILRQLQASSYVHFCETFTMIPVAGCFYSALKSRAKRGHVSQPQNCSFSSLVSHKGRYEGVVTGRKLFRQKCGQIMILADRAVPQQGLVASKEVFDLNRDDELVHWKSMGSSLANSKT